MLKQRIENKGEAKPYVSPYTDKPIRREDVEDPERPGHAKTSLFPAPPDVWNALGYYRLLANGKQSWPVEQAPDPLNPRVEEAPEDLRLSLATAEEAKKAWERRRQELFEAGLRATERWKLAARKQDAKTYNAGLAEELQVAEDLRHHEVKLPDIQIELGKAHDGINRWLYLERLRRTEAAAR